MSANDIRAILSNYPSNKAEKAAYDAAVAAIDWESDDARDFITQRREELLGRVTRARDEALKYSLEYPPEGAARLVEEVMTQLMVDLSGPDPVPYEHCGFTPQDVVFAWDVFHQYEGFAGLITLLHYTQSRLPLRADISSRKIANAWQRAMKNPGTQWAVGILEGVADDPERRASITDENIAENYYACREGYYELDAGTCFRIMRHPELAKAIPQARMDVVPISIYSTSNPMPMSVIYDSRYDDAIAKMERQCSVFLGPNNRTGAIHDGASSFKKPARRRMAAYFADIANNDNLPEWQRYQALKAEKILLSPPKRRPA